MRTSPIRLVLIEASACAFAFSVETIVVTAPWPATCRPAMPCGHLAGGHLRARQVARDGVELQPRADVAVVDDDPVDAHQHHRGERLQAFLAERAGGRPRAARPR